MSGMWKEFLWGGMAGVIGETIMHPMDTLKTRIQSGSSTGINLQKHNVIREGFKGILRRDGFQGFYRGVIPGMTGSLATGATYFGFIETTKDWLNVNNPSLAGPWAHFLAGAAGDTLGSVVYVPCEVIKQRMQIQGSKKAWQSSMTQLNKAPGGAYYYTGVFSAAKHILRHEGVHGLYAGYFSTLARDVPFAGFQIMFYEAFREAVVWNHARLSRPVSSASKYEFGSAEELVLGGAAGGISAFLTTPMDIIKTRLQVQGTNIRYKGWLDALQTIWKEERIPGLFKGAVPRIMWFVPAAGLTFMSVELLRKTFNGGPAYEVESLPLPPRLPSAISTHSPNSTNQLPVRASAASVDLASLANSRPPLEEQVR
ncbi:solute carrier family 25 (mitochondrial S-adenosylmethionine transporter), member 26 [Marchantia polymorpha subsp. ruderalis]|uniref:Mitochondrial carrier protein n=2 Tax=Marchantia polymorpha TaxID=3197 RepID=A0AAF6ASY3_MARPO|nr:hypothetical protein MARPO_0001s0536 [Marchantia polymorpha]BBM99553.1 hypothetical protein Mp_1g22000 [Marchantia polymorpha subsp. ruderalis]|eukprot:PTQ50637.1 hypothetical protein MARPO_0001s0536 [Marchantia polymorpha]